MNINRCNNARLKHNFFAFYSRDVHDASLEVEAALIVSLQEKNSQHSGSNKDLAKSELTPSILRSRRDLQGGKVAKGPIYARRNDSRSLGFRGERKFCFVI
jgi:hypothetical protein